MNNRHGQMLLKQCPRLKSESAKHIQWILRIAFATISVVTISCDGKTEGPDGTQKCVTSIKCVAPENDPYGDYECPYDYRCNTALIPPRCQNEGCGKRGTPCSSQILCDEHECLNGICVAELKNGIRESCTPDCNNRVCGKDPNCGTSCGSCRGGYFCHEGECLYNDQSFFFVMLGKWPKDLLRSIKPNEALELFFDSIGFIFLIIVFIIPFLIVSFLSGMSPPKKRRK